MPELETIEYTQWPNVRLHCGNDVVFDASMNDYNRFKLDQIDQINEFPELLIEDCNAHHGVLQSGSIEVIVYLERRCIK